MSQDRDEAFALSGKRFRGGGEAGGGRASRAAPVVYERHIPKFLLPYAHLIDKKKNPHDGRASPERRQNAEASVNDEDVDDRDQAVRNLQPPMRTTVSWQRIVSLLQRSLGIVLLRIGVDRLSFSDLRRRDAWRQQKLEKSSPPASCLETGDEVLHCKHVATSTL